MFSLTSQNRLRLEIILLLAIVAFSLIQCQGEKANEISSLREENTVLKEKIAQLELEKNNLQEKINYLQGQAEVQAVSKQIPEITQPILEKEPTLSQDEVIVYITRTGEKYHSAGCRYLSRSCIPIELSTAKARGYTPCSRCSPPR